MRDLEVCVALPVPASIALRTMYDDAGAYFAAFHRAVSRDADARVSGWDAATRTRTVSFIKRLDMPAALAKIFGAGPTPQAAGPSTAVGSAPSALPLRARRARAHARSCTCRSPYTCAVAPSQATSRPFR